MNISKKLLSLTAALAITVTTLISGTAALAEEPADNQSVKIVEDGEFGHPDPDDDGLLDPKDIPTAADVKAGKAGMGKKEKKPGDNFKADASVTIVKAEAPTLDRSISSFEKTVHDGKTTRSVKLDVGNVNATASADAGLSAKDGLRVQVNTQAAVTAAKATGTAEYNDGTVSGKATGTVAVGVARAKGNATAKFGPDGAEVDAHISAEANLAEAKGEVSGSVGGVQVKATGTLTVGVGAKAGATLKNGKLKIEAGASVGVGGSFTVEVDLSKAKFLNPKALLEKKTAEENKLPENLRFITDDPLKVAPICVPGIANPTYNLLTNIVGMAA